jgi:hypothetical protein
MAMSIAIQAMTTDIESDELKGDALINFLVSALEPALDFTAEKCAVYVWHQDARRREFMAALDALEVFIHQIVIWLKPNFVIGRCNYHHIFEPCFHGWLKGKRPRVYGERTKLMFGGLSEKMTKFTRPRSPSNCFPSQC